MQRREFIRNVGLTALSPFILDSLLGCAGNSNSQRVLVLIQLVGGNDGLNMLIPLDNYKAITQVRPNLYIPENKILQLSGNELNGLHPSMDGIKEMFDDGLLSFIQGVGYENPDYSHFRSTDIWLTGSSSSQILKTGWMARYLENKEPHVASSVRVDELHPPAIKIGEMGTFLFQGTRSDLGVVVDPYVGLNVPDVDKAHLNSNTYSSEKIKSIREILLKTKRYEKVINDALQLKSVNSGLYPEKGVNPLADQLKTVAQLMHAGLQTSVFMVELKGFDTHDSQVDSNDTTKGTHANLLNMLSQAITCFWDDLRLIGREDDVLGVTFSEFGRRIMSNASYGTDHGSAQPILVFGKNVKPGIWGNNPIIPDHVTLEDNLSVQYDFRNVFSSVMVDWLGAERNAMQDVFNVKESQIQIING